ncbi:MAG: hypothetical protein C5B60_02520 [Chloroflexi bacterium]|nr:MAG: hypothetical protein C5B60_02520 [Chloroflexota bacterium]
MICTACHGSGKRLNPRLPKAQTGDGGWRVLRYLPGEPLLIPCGECINGIASCCDAAGIVVEQVAPLPDLPDLDWLDDLPDQ